ncbi:MAG: galactokinase [Gemmatimonadetes bacterium]|nr:galactokinase [Gemmatimonadota bacterium]NNM32359.1 galactokinase [Gemmatimonadota bacterium]
MAWRVVAPGRVNLIGEHTDYNHLPVLPMAIDRTVEIEFVVLARPEVRLTTPLPDLSPVRFSLDEDMGRAPQGDWSNYPRAAAKGLLDEGLSLDRGISGTVRGTVPLAAGLSSSSALVVATSLALLHANGHRMDPLALSATAARAERFVGLEGGGMDQAVCVHGQRGMAVRVDFAPLRVTRVPIPGGWRWLVAHSLIQAEKAGSAREAYNDRAATCRIALSGLADAWNEPALTYQELVRRPDALDEASRLLEPRVLRRFRHVISEADRVDRAQAAMVANDPEEFGRLMSLSHASLRDEYEVSLPALDEMVRIAETAGAYGARLTGAGFGGCIVALCSPDSLSKAKEALLDRYYPNRPSPPAALGSSPEAWVFEVRSSDGARVEAAGAELS